MNIDIVLNWRYDIENAPRGITTVTERFVPGAKGKPDQVRNVSAFTRQNVLLAIVDKGDQVVTLTYRTEASAQNPDGYWAGCATDQEVYAWAEWPIAAPYYFKNKTQ